MFLEKFNVVRQLLPLPVETAPHGGNNNGVMKPPLKLRGELSDKVRSERNVGIKRLRNWTGLLCCVGAFLKFFL
jgi:hypothetical protein